MNIYKITRVDTDLAGYDEYLGAIVVANTPKQAASVELYDRPLHYWTWDNLIVVNVGTTDKYTEPTVLLTDFNAG